MYYTVANEIHPATISIHCESMKTLSSTLICVTACALAVASSFSQTVAANSPRPSEVAVLEMKSVPDGHFLVKLHVDGSDRLLNIKVKGNVGECTKSDDTRFNGLRGEFQLVGNGVFVVFFRNDNHRASQYWLFQKDGTAVVKEVPDRGEKQTATPVENDSIETPKRVK
jgi:hypothetical protein